MTWFLPVGSTFSRALLQHVGCQFSDSNISQGCVVVRLNYDFYGICNDCFIANLLLSVPVKEL